MGSDDGAGEDTSSGRIVAIGNADDVGDDIGADASSGRIVAMGSWAREPSGIYPVPKNR